jgi:hypothetical protein
MKKINTDGLLALNLEEIEIVYRRCRRDSVEKIAQEMGMSPSTIWNSRMPEIFRLLDVENWNDIEEELCIPLRRIILSVEDLKKGWPEEFREKIEALREPSKPPGGQLPAKGQKDSEARTRPRTSIPWPVFAIPLLILCVASIIGVTIAGEILAPRIPELLPIFQGAQPQAQLPESTSTQEPTAIAAQINPTDTVSVLTEEATPTSSNTPTPTSTFTPTPTPTFTSTPTLSPTPAATDTPESGEPTVLHSDNFQKGLDSSWNKLYGNASVVSGVLTTDNNVMLAIGDTNWINYAITLKSTASKDMHYCTDTLEHDYVAFRMQDRDNFYAFSWGRCGTAWYIVENGNWNRVPESYVQDLIQINDHEIEIDIEGNFFQAYVDGNPQANFYDDRYTIGGLGLRIDKFVSVDDWLVKALP